MKRLPRDERPIVAEACEACEFQNGDVPCRKEHFAEISTNGSLQKKEEEQSFFLVMKDNKNGERTCEHLQLTIRMIMMIMMILMTVDENGTHGYIYIYIYTVHIKVELRWSMAMLQVGQKAR